MRRGKAIGYVEDEQGTVWLGEGLKFLACFSVLDDALDKIIHIMKSSIYRHFY